MVEHRRLDRIQLIYYLQVLQQQDQEQIGSLVDITTEGMKIISSEKIPVNRKFELRMRLPEGCVFGDFLDFSALSVWCRPDVNPDYFGTGLKIKDLGQSGFRVIEGLIRDYRMKGLL